MRRSLLAQSLEPLVAISWGLFLIWSVWLGLVWTLGISQQWLGLPIAQSADWGAGTAALVQDAPPPPHADLRRAVLVLADHAELAWFSLALIQIHLHVIASNGVNTARTWLGIAVGGAFLLAAANRAFGVPFGWMHFSPVMGAQFLGVPLGWLLLWAVLLIGSREAVARVWRRGSHGAVAAAGAAVVVLTLANLHPIAREGRAWWFWHTGSVREPAATPWWFWLSCGLAAWVLLWLIRERTVLAGAAERSAKPLVILGLLNLAALAARIF
jgi:hypothetical protein